MKHLLIAAGVLIFAGTAKAQVSASQLTGTWTAVAVQMPKNDTITRLNNDSAVASALTAFPTVSLADLEKNAKTREEQFGLMLLKMSEVMYLQFSDKGEFWDGKAKDKNFKESQSAKKGTYAVSVDGKTVTTAISSISGDMNSSNYNADVYNGLLKMQSENSPIIIYLKRISATPIFDK